MKRRPTRWRHSSWERVKVHPRGDREKIAALTADMVRAFMDGDLDTYWKSLIDRSLGIADSTQLEYALRPRRKTTHTRRSFASCRMAKSRHPVQPLFEGHWR